jgi:predicted DsbA family dithiol-disulfide isomerase
MSTIFVQYVSDYTCPYCYAERVALLQAAKDFDVDIQWLPYEYTPLSKPQVDAYHDPVRKAKYRKTLAPLCKKLNLEMKLPPKVIPRPYTNLAMQAHYLADLHEKGEEFSDRVLTAYYVEEKDIGKIDVLVAIAEDVGLDGAEFSQALNDGTYAKALERIEQYVQDTIQPKNIPTLLIGDTIRLDGGLHTVEQLRQFLSQAQETQESITISGVGCSESGCGL